MGFFAMTAASRAQTQASAITDDKESSRHETREERKANRLLRKEEAEYEPTQLVAQHFERDFPNAQEVSWIVRDFETAGFVNEGKIMHAFYDWKGELIGTTTAIDYTTLPLSARKQIEKGYKDYTIGEVVLFDDNEFNESDMMLYGSSFDDEDNYFVALTKESKELILKVDQQGNVSYFQEINE